MVAALPVSGLLGVSGLALWMRPPCATARHLADDWSRLTVDYLVRRVEAEANGGQHRAPEPVVLRGALSEALTAEETRLLSLVESGSPVDDRDAMAQHPGMPRRVHAGLRRL